jgi:hypothetical protein
VQERERLELERRRWIMIEGTARRFEGSDRIWKLGGLQGEEEGDAIKDG